MENHISDQEYQQDLQDKDRFYAKVKEFGPFYLAKRFEKRGKKDPPFQTYEETLENVILPQILAHLNNHVLDTPLTILDVGCGFGQQSIWFAEKGFNVVGVDYSELGIKIAKSDAAQKNCEITPNFFCEDIMEFGCPRDSSLPKQFDIIWLHKFLHQVRPQEFMKLRKKNLFFRQTGRSYCYQYHGYQSSIMWCRSTN